MAQYYSAFFQSGLSNANVDVPPTRPPASRHRHSTSSYSVAPTEASAPVFFVLSHKGSLRSQHPRSSSANGRPTHASFLSMDADAASTISSVAPPPRSSTVPPPLSLSIPRKPANYQPFVPPSTLPTVPPSPTPSAPPRMGRPPPSPAPTVLSIKSAVDVPRRPGRAPSNASSTVRRTNRNHALAALEGQRLRSVPESRSFVPFDSDEEDAAAPEDEESAFARFVERTRAAALREQAEREQRARDGPLPPSYDEFESNFIDLDDDAAQSSRPAVPPPRLPPPTPPPRPPTDMRRRSGPVHAPVPVRSQATPRPAWPYQVASPA